MRVVALCGGVGGAKLADGLQQILGADLTLIINTGDDFEHRGLPVWPDVDTVLYTLAGIANSTQGWGRAAESWEVQREWQRLGIDTWFQLGDKDIALHLLRREWQSHGWSAARVCSELAALYGVSARLLPMSNAPAPTRILTSAGELPFQEYFVKLRCAPAVSGFAYGASAQRGASCEVLATLEEEGLDGVILCPSNPYLSIAPILAVPGLRKRLAELNAPVIGVSPIIARDALKGPTAKIMRELGIDVSPLTVALEYRDFLDALLIDTADVADLPATAHGSTLVGDEIVMRNTHDRRRLAARCLKLLAELRTRPLV